VAMSPAQPSLFSFLKFLKSDNAIIVYIVTTKNEIHN
jgi:hypothetical protein